MVMLRWSETLRLARLVIVQERGGLSRADAVAAVASSVGYPRGIVRRAVVSAAFRGVRG